MSFNGAQLIAAQDKSTGKIYAGISCVCNGMGLTKTQKDTQVEKIQVDLTLKRGCRKFPAGVFDPNNTTLALEIEFVPLWLAKITITPTMQAEQPELTERLIEYQLKAKDVLVEAFLSKVTRRNLKICLLNNI